ncbi:MAG: diaminopimelate decarboxylase [Verrucomicrobia bacterium]|nr:diaminopimelate decarboxylase [Verrucomicrobiota bacterium]
MHSFHYRDGELFCEEVRLAQAAEEFGTPLYLYSAATILDHYHRLDRALHEIDHLISYAVKANSNGAILKLLSNAGAGFDIVSGGELFRVLRAGGDPGRCTFAGVGKTPEEMGYALEQRVYCLNVESEGELERIEEIADAKNIRAPVALRINPDVQAHTHEYVSTGSEENKFGITLADAPRLYARAAQMRHIDLRGVQMHIGSQITAAAPFAEAIRKVTPLARELKEKYGIEFLSIGGGLGIVYERSIASGERAWWAEGHQLSIQEYADAILPELRGLGLRILLEPGRLLVGNAGVLLTRVLYLKESGRKRFAVVDAGMNDLIRPALYGSYHEIVPVEQPSTEQRSEIDIVGPVCESGDFLARDREMPPVAAGDLLAVMSTGAYGFTMASNYNSRLLPAEALVDGNCVRLIRRRQTWQDLVCGETDC